ncbi:MAG: hypothetical protein WCV72_02995 [Patescibacteria group bacterium]
MVKIENLNYLKMPNESKEFSRELKERRNFYDGSKDVAGGGAFPHKPRTGEEMSFQILESGSLKKIPNFEINEHPDFPEVKFLVPYGAAQSVLKRWEAVRKAMGKDFEALSAETRIEIFHAIVKGVEY